MIEKNAKKIAKENHQKESNAWVRNMPGGIVYETLGLFNDIENGVGRVKVVARTLA